MKRFLFLALTFSLVAAADAQTYSLRVLLDGQPINWDPGEGVNRNGEFFEIDDTSAPLVVLFDGGQLELNLADFGTFSQPHVTGFRFVRDADPGSFSMGATVRHQEKGWDDYADIIVFDGAENGRLTLNEPKDDKPFTRSKDNLRANAQVRVSALDNLRSGDGSAIVVDFSQSPFMGLERGNLRYELELQPEN